MQAIKRGAVMENVVLDDKLKPDFKDTSLTQNTRVAYPLNHVDNRVLAAQSHHPEHIIFYAVISMVCYPLLPSLMKNRLHTIS